jgi:hypothetical protein
MQWKCDTEICYMRKYIIFLVISSIFFLLYVEIYLFSQQNGWLNHLS